tara:strand:+ start:1503 stop:1604 length:102 start_codon:yes stop_codon:yes gene_type:complete
MFHFATFLGRKGAKIISLHQGKEEKEYFLSPFP